MSNVLHVPAHILQNTSDIWIRKCLALFRLFDQEKKNVIGAKELYDNIDANIARVLTTKQLESMDMKPVSDRIWNRYWAPCMRSEGGQKVVHFNDFVTARYNIMRLNPEEDKRDIRDVMTSIWKLFDLDHNGFVDFDEYLLMAETFGMTKYAAKVAFAAVDVDCDDLMSCEEHTNTHFKMAHDLEFNSGAFTLGVLPDDDIRAM